MVVDRRQFAIQSSLAIVSLTGLAASIVGLLPTLSFSWPLSVVVFAVIVLLSLAFAAVRSRRAHLSVDELLPEDCSVCVALMCPCDVGLARQANALAQRSYGRVDSIAFERYEQWRMKNRNILVCLVDINRRVVGYFDVIPLTTRVSQEFIAGRVVETDIRANDIVSPRKTKQCDVLYLGGIAVDGAGTHVGHRRASWLMWGMSAYIDHYCGWSSDKTIIAEAATEAGERLLRRLGFEVMQPGPARRNGLALYGARLSDGMRARLRQRFPDWSGACAVSWERRSVGAVGAE